MSKALNPSLIFPTSRKSAPTGNRTIPPIILTGQKPSPWRSQTRSQRPKMSHCGYRSICSIRLQLRLILEMCRSSCLSMVCGK